MSKYAQYEAEMRNIADGCRSLQEVVQEVEDFTRKIDADLDIFERETRQTTMEERERLRGIATELRKRPEKGPFADEFLDKLYDALRSHGGRDGLKS